MYIKSFQLKNYKSYLNSNLLHLAQGFNIIAGKNNAGKTALLEALSQKFDNIPHKSLETMPQRDSVHDSLSSCTVTIEVSREELRDIFLTPNKSNVTTNANRFSSPNKQNSQFFIPLPTVGSNFGDSTFTSPAYAELKQLVEWFFSRDHTFTFDVQNKVPVVSKCPTFGCYEAQMNQNQCLFARVILEEDGTWTVKDEQNKNDKAQDLGRVVATHLSERIYSFKAERFPSSNSLIGNRTDLDSSTRNLPEVIANMANNPKRFQRFNDTLRRIFPQIHGVSTRNVAGNQTEIVVWMEDPNLGSVPRLP